MCEVPKCDCAGCERNEFHIAIVIAIDPSLAGVKPRISNDITLQNCIRALLHDGPTAARLAAFAAKAAQRSTSRSDPAESAPPAALAASTLSQPATEQLSQPAPVQAPVPARVMTTREPAPTPHWTNPDLVTRQLDRDEMASMLQRADDFIRSGDLSSARLLLQRAAEAGSVNAALALAGTYDPNVLKTLGFQEGAADIAMARLWYERAKRFGSPEAPRRLQLLATAINSAQ